LVQSRQRSATAAGRTDHLVSVHEWRLGVTPARHHLPFEILVHVDLPPLLAGRRVSAHQNPLSSQGIQCISVSGWRAARTISVGVTKHSPNGRHPDLLACFAIEGEEVFVILAGSHGDKTGADNRWA